jgi:signal transduction histidine kinase
MFQRFFRAGCGEETPGHGLGLSIARELAEINQGELELVSSDNQWTAFRLRLPNAEPIVLNAELVPAAAK